MHKGSQSLVGITIRGSTRNHARNDSLLTEGLRDRTW